MNDYNYNTVNAGMASLSCIPVQNEADFRIGGVGRFGCFANALARHTLIEEIWVILLGGKAAKNTTRRRRPVSFYHTSI
jgi:hypothetical protein